MARLTRSQFKARVIHGESTKPIDSCSSQEAQLNMNHIQALSLQAPFLFKDFENGWRASGK